MPPRIRHLPPFTPETLQELLLISLQAQNLSVEIRWLAPNRENPQPPQAWRVELTSLHEAGKLMIMAVDQGLKTKYVSSLERPGLFKAAVSFGDESLSCPLALSPLQIPKSGQGTVFEKNAVRVFVCGLQIIITRLGVSQFYRVTEYSFIR